MYEKDFLRGYELRNWNLSPRIYKILAVSTMINILALFVFSQGNLLTRKGCDSPFVSTVCQVLDTVYLSKVIYGTDTGYVDNPEYVAQNLGDADITFVDLTGETPPLSYPAGYFPLANPDQFTTNEEGDIVRKSDFEVVNDPATLNNFNPSPNPTPVPYVAKKNTPSLRDQPPVYTPKNKNPVKGVLPQKRSDRDKTDGGDENSTDTGDSKNTAENKTDEQKVDPNSAKEGEAIADVTINREPIRDLGKYVNKIKEEDKEFSLETPFTVRARGRLKKDGRFDADTFKYVQAESSNEKMIEVVKQAIEAIDAAGYLQYLKKFDGKDLDLMLKQDDKDITAIVQSEFETKERANSIKIGLDLYIAFSKKNKTAPEDKDDLELLNSAEVKTDGKKIIIKFAIPNEKAQEMIKRKLLEQDKKDKQTNGKTSASKIGEANANTGK